jgi:hypothetical protein
MSSCPSSAREWKVSDMSQETTTLYTLITRYRLHWRHPKELGPVLRKIEKDRLRPDQARRWLKKIKPWVEEQQRCFNPFPPAPDQEELGRFDIEVGHLTENPGVRVGVRLLDRPRHLIAAGGTGSGKSNLLRRLIVGLDAINRGGIAHHGSRTRFQG